MATKPQRLVHVVHYKEAPDAIQWDKEFYSKPEADNFAIEITLNGGMALVVPEYREDDIVIGQPKDDEDEEAV